MEVNLHFKIDEQPYMVSLNVTGRRVTKAKVFKQKAGSPFLTEIPSRVKTSTRREEIMCWWCNARLKIIRLKVDLRKMEPYERRTRNDYRKQRI